jgi:hypothetical protein
MCSKAARLDAEHYGFDEPVPALSPACSEHT